MVVAIAASSALAGTSIKFIWKGDNPGNWNVASNWRAVSGDSQDLTYDQVSSDYKVDSGVSEFYPGRVVPSKGSSVDVVISKDAVINVTSGLLGINSITVRGTNTVNAKVTLNMGGNGFFVTAPLIDVSADTANAASLTVNGTNDSAFALKKDTTWKTFNAPLDINAPVKFGDKDVYKLTLDVTSADLTVRKALLNNTELKVTGPNANLIFAETVENNSGEKLDVTLSGDASFKVEEGKTVTLNVWSDDKCAVEVSGGNFKKTGAGTLVLNRADTTHRKQPVLSKDVAINVYEGTLTITGGQALNYVDKEENPPVFTISEDATFNVGKNAIYIKLSADFIVKGNLALEDHAIHTKSNDAYTGKLAVYSEVSMDVAETGTVTFAGSQAIKHLSGKGKVSMGTNSILFLNSTSADIEGFTGTLENASVGIVNGSFDTIPFAGASNGVDVVNVFGPEGKLTLDKALLDAAGTEGLDKTSVYLRADVLKDKDYTYMDVVNSNIGKLDISGDIALDKISIDGTRTNANVGIISFKDKGSKLKASELVLHAQSLNTDNYDNMYAVVVSGDGTFTPDAISNADTGSTKLGVDASILVKDGATLVMKEGVDFPAGNGVHIDGATLQVAENTTVGGNLLIDNGSQLNVSLNSKNYRDRPDDTDYTPAVKVNGIFALSQDLSIDVVGLEDSETYIGKQYAILMFNNLDDGTEISTDHIALVGDYKNNFQLVDDKDAKTL